MLGGDFRMLRDERLVTDVDNRELVHEPLRIGEAKALAVPLRLDPLRSESLGPEVEGGGRAHAPDDAVDHSRAGAAAGKAWILEERQVEAGRGVLVAVEQVVDRRVVLIDGLLDHPKAHHARVEVDVAGRVAGDRGDVVDAVELHASLRIGSGCSRNYIIVALAARNEPRPPPPRRPAPFRRSSALRVAPRTALLPGPRSPRRPPRARGRAPCEERVRTRSSIASSRRCGNLSYRAPRSGLGRLPRLHLA